jgi:thiol-activated cytolysin
VFHNSRVALVSIVACAALTACADDVSSPNNVANAKASDSVIVSVPKYPEAKEFKDSTVTRADTIVVSRVDSINNMIVDTTWLEQSIHISAADNPDQFMMFDPNPSVLWPGNLVQGKSLASGVPQAVPIFDRAPAKLFLAVVSGDSAGASQKMYRTVDRLSGSSAMQAMNEILAGYKGAAAAKYTFTQEKVHSSTQINFTLGFGYSGPATTVDGRFGFQMSNAQSRVAVRLTQQFFSMAMDDPQGAAGVFGPSVSPSTLLPYVGDGNPLCYISSVTYGRVFILVYESTASELALQQALNFAYSGGVASGNIKDTLTYNQVMSQTKVTVTQIGGDASAGLLLTSPKNFKTITEFLSKGANFSPTNVGAPISYTVKYLRDASLVRMSSTMEYDYIQRTPLASKTKPTNSTFGVFLSDVYIPSSSDPNGGDGGVGMQVGVTDDVTGKDSVVYGAPWNHPDAMWDLGQDKMTTGASFSLNWTTPQFTVADAPGKRIYVQFWANEYDAVRDWKTVRVYIEYDAVARKWRRSNAQQSLTQMLLSNVGGDTNVQFNFQVRRNGVQITQ